jgi:hypothetical protein
MATATKSGKTNTYICATIWNKDGTGKEYMPGDRIELTAEEAINALKRGSVKPLRSEPRKAVDVPMSAEQRVIMDEIKRIEEAELASDD